MSDIRTKQKQEEPVAYVITHLRGSNLYILMIHVIINSLHTGTESISFASPIKTEVSAYENIQSIFNRYSPNVGNHSIDEPQ